MDSKRIRSMLSHCIQGKRVPDIYLRSKGFSNDEIREVEALGYIELADTTPWGDRRLLITLNGENFKMTGDRVIPTIIQ